MAHSSQFNPRNLEAPWYGPYGYTFQDLITANGALNLVVVPQAALWLTEVTLEEAMREIAERIERLDAENLTAVQQHDAEDDEEWDENAVANISVLTQETVSGAEIEGTPDFAFVHLCSKAMPVLKARATKAQQGAFRRRGGFSTAHQCFPGFLELKQSPSRHTKNRLQEQSAAFQHRLQSSQDRAVRQLVRYCNIYTRQSKTHPPGLPILLLAGSGAWWCYHLAPLDTIPLWNFEESVVFNQESSRYAALLANFSQFYELGTAESDRMLDHLYATHLVLFEEHSNPVLVEDDGDDLVGDYGDDDEEDGDDND